MKKLSIAYLLIGCAAIAQGVLWINAFKMLHSDMLAYMGGVPAGIAIVGLSARSANILPGVKSKRARQWGWAMLVILMIAEPFVLGAANYHAMGAKSYIVAYGTSLVISVALVMGAIVERSLVAKPQPARSTKRTTKATKQTAKPIVQEIEPAKVYECTWPGCEWNTSQSKAVQKGGEPVPALAAHVSHHNRAVAKIEAEKAAKAER